MAKASRWLPIFEAFVRDLRIASKEVTSTDERGVKLELWESQKRFLKEIATGLDDDIRTFICLKSRQLGITTISLAIDVFWLAMHPNLIGALVSDTDKNRNKNRAQIERYVKSLPDGYFGETFAIVKSNINFTQFSNGSRIDYLVAGTKNKGTSWGEGEGYAFAHLTEVASYGDPQGLASFEESFAQTNPDRLFIYESPLALDTPVLTPHGWATVGSVEVGDRVYDETGDETEVVGLSPVFEGRRCFEITFDTGEKIVSDAVHKWQVERMGSSTARWSTRVVTTEQIDPSRDRIFLGGPVCGIDQDLPINPYFLGAWLGDGHNEAVRITCGEQDMLEMRNNLKSRGVVCGPVTKYKGRSGGVFGIHGFMPVFNELNLISNKHIPEIYLRALVEDRLELLRGLMDTDGSIVKSGHCTFTNSCRALLDNFCELLSSLGIRSHTTWVHPGSKRFPNGKIYECLPYAHVGFMAPEGADIFSLKRKVSRQATDSKRTPRRNRVARVISVKEVPSVPVKCLSVDTPSHLFRVGRSLIPTHNTAKGFNHFREKYQKSKEEQFTKKAFFIGWWASNVNRIEKRDPRFQKFGTYKPTGEERDLVLMVQTLYGYKIQPEQLAWIRWKPTDTSADDPNLLDQNQPWVESQAFIMTGHSFFLTREIAKDMRILDESDIVFKGYTYEYGNVFFEFKMRSIEDEEERHLIDLKIWDEPVEGAKYVIGADPAYGRNDHKDRHCASIWRCYADKIVQVAEFATSDIEAKHFAWVLAHLAAIYKDCIVNLEIGGPGRMIMLEWEHIRGMMKAEMYAQQVRQMGWDDAMDQARWYLYHRPDSMGAGYAANFETNWRTKSEIMHQMRGAYATRELDIRSMYLLNEMSLVVQDGSQIGAPESRSETCKDDRVFACALALRAWINWVRPTMMAEGLTFSRVNNEESGQASALTNRLNDQVSRFFKRKDAEEDVEPERAPKWLTDRGLA